MTRPGPTRRDQLLKLVGHRKMKRPVRMVFNKISNKWTEASYHPYPTGNPIDTRKLDRWTLINRGIQPVPSHWVAGHFEWLKWKSDNGHGNTIYFPFELRYNPDTLREDWYIV